jgi:predicted nucleic acid-binding protein
MIFVDSSVWIDFFNGVINIETDKLDNLLGREPLVVGDLILVEVLQGFKSDLQAERAKSLLLRLDYRNMLGKDISVKSASLYRNLIKKGLTIRKPIDVWIANFCIEESLLLLQRDRDFKSIAKVTGLQLI